jgi:hypothetical protein
MARLDRRKTPAELDGQIAFGSKNNTEKFARLG